MFFANDSGDNLTKPTEAPVPVVEINTAVTPRVEDEQRLIVAGWAPKERMGFAIWANPETGFYFSQKMALHRLDERSGA